MKSKIKVLFIANIPSPYRVDFFNELGKFCELTVLFERETSDDRELSWYNNSFNSFRYIFLKGIKINKNTALCLGVLKYLKSELFDITIVGGYSTPTGMLAIEILRLRKIPFILNTDGGIIRKDSRLKFHIKKHFIRSAKFWLSTGKHTTNYLVHYGANKKNIFVYPFTSILQKDIEENLLNGNKKREIKSNLAIDEEKVILSVGQFIERKGFDILLKASASLSEKYGIYIVGGEPKEEHIKLKNELNLQNVHFVGFKTKDELKEYYLASDLFVLPTREDIWGLVINEAMAHGLPVITTKKCVAGLELVKDIENGYIIPVNNSEILINKIMEISENEKLSLGMANKNIMKIKEYTIEKMVMKHTEIFNYILNRT